MAGGKKKRKPISNPARGFATTSIPSKPKGEAASAAPVADDESKPEAVAEAPIEASATTNGANAAEKQANAVIHLGPEEFEKQLDQSELQNLVEKHAQRSKREATRQINRLQTDRRLLRSQADVLNTRKWLPAELIDEIYELLSNDHLPPNGLSQDNQKSTKAISDEDLTIRLWTLQQALEGAGFIQDKVSRALDYITAVSEKISIGNKESIWGLEESLEWLARECPKNELPDYDNIQRKAACPRLQAGKCSHTSHHLLQTDHVLTLQKTLPMKAPQHPVSVLLREYRRTHVRVMRLSQEVELKVMLLARVVLAPP
jgi:ATP-dependent RNA helicase DHX29